MSTLAKYQEVLEYISQNVSSAMTQDLERRIRNADDLHKDGEKTAELLEALSTKGAGVLVFNGAARRIALRALLLCQRVYLAKPVQDYDWYKWITNWPKITIDYWKSKSEAEIKRGIEMYMPTPNRSASQLASVAGAMGPTVTADMLPLMHCVTRDMPNFPIEKVCYRAVQSWMLASGNVSLQWFVKSTVSSVMGQVDEHNSQPAQLLRIFGPGKQIAVSDKATHSRIGLTRGQIIYMYRANQDGTPKAAGQLGHWMVVSGNNGAYGCNNFTTGPAQGTLPNYDHANIIGQIRGMQLTTIIPLVPDSHFLRVYNPDQLERYPSD